MKRSKKFWLMFPIIGVLIFIILKPMVVLVMIMVGLIIIFPIYMLFSLIDLLSWDDYDDMLIDKKYNMFWYIGKLIINLNKRIDNYGKKVS